jgi:hypothetical protein
MDNRPPAKSSAPCVDIFYVLAWATVLLLPVMFLLKQLPPGPAAAGH